MLACAALLLVMAANMLTAIQGKSLTHDEPLYIAHGYGILTAADFSTNIEHPPLHKMIAALPLLFLKLNPWDRTAADRPAQFWADNKSSFAAMAFWGRMPAIALTVVLGVLIFGVARALFGNIAGVFAVFLLSFEPTMLAHGRVAVNDVPAALVYLLFFAVLWRYVRLPTGKGAIALGLAGGLACVTKFSMLLVAPILAATFAVLIWRARRDAAQRTMLLRHVAVAGLAAILAINAAYLFQHRPITDGDLATQKFESILWIVRPAFQAVAMLLPADFIVGALAQIRHGAIGHPASLLGMHSAQGWHYYFPVAFALKVPLPILLLSIASLVWCAYRAIKHRDTRCMLLLGAFGLYVLFCCASTINIGIRYLLPAFPFLFIMAGGFLSAAVASMRPVHLVIACALLSWTAWEAVRTYPHYMPYMNALASPKPHWFYLSDSNVEWGDDAKGLSDYLQARGERRVEGAMLGSFTLPFFGIDHIDLTAPNAGPLAAARYVAIGASYLNGASVPGPVVRGKNLTEDERVNYFAAYRTRQPETVIGGSIYVFRND